MDHATALRSDGGRRADGNRPQSESSVAFEIKAELHKILPSPAARPRHPRDAEKLSAPATTLSHFSAPTLQSRAARPERKLGCSKISKVTKVKKIHAIRSSNKISPKRSAKIARLPAHPLKHARAAVRGPSKKTNKTNDQAFPLAPPPSPPGMPHLKVRKSRSTTPSRKLRRPPRAPFPQPRPGAFPPFNR
jgi:hypothetical protein